MSALAGDFDPQNVAQELRNQFSEHDVKRRDSQRRYQSYLGAWRMARATPRPTSTTPSPSPKKVWPVDAWYRSVDEFPLGCGGTPAVGFSGFRANFEGS